MAIQDMFKGNVAMSLAVGLAAAVLVPIVLPVVVRAAKPVAKAIIKTGLIVYEKGRESLAEAGEVMEDMVAEAKSELEHEHMAKMAATQAAPVTPSQSPGG